MWIDLSVTVNLVIISKVLVGNYLCAFFDNLKYVGFFLPKPAMAVGLKPVRFALF